MDHPWPYGTNVRVIDQSSPHYNQTGTVFGFAPDAYTQSQPPTPIPPWTYNVAGIPGSKALVNFLDSQLEIV